MLQDWPSSSDVKVCPLLKSGMTGRTAALELIDEQQQWAVPCKECDAATANSFKLGAVPKGSLRPYGNAE